MPNEAFPLSRVHGLSSSPCASAQRALTPLKLTSSLSAAREARRSTYEETFSSIRSPSGDDIWPLWENNDYRPLQSSLPLLPSPHTSQPRVGPH